VLWAAGDADGASAAHFEQAFVAQQPEGAQDGVAVYAEDGGEVACLGDAVAGTRFAVGDRAADLGGDLLVQRGGVGAIDGRERDGATVGGGFWVVDRNHKNQL
jgi:hypothetical protein